MAGEGHTGDRDRAGFDRVLALIPVALAVLFLYLLFQVFQPFLGSIAWALILGILFSPLHRRVRRWLKERRSLAALLMTLLVIVVIVIPAVILSVVLARQAAQGITRLADTVSRIENEQGSAILSHPLLTKAKELILPRINLKDVEFRQSVLSALRKLSAGALDWSTALLQNLVRMFFGLFVMLFTLYYVFKDGGAARAYMDRIHPVIRETGVVKTLEDLTLTTFYAGFVTAAVQGCLAGVAFAVLGVPSAFFWGTMTALMSFVPIMGATAVWLPMVVWLAIKGSTTKAIGLAVWGVGVVSVSDNLIKPALISGRMNLHPLLVFFAVLGGLSYFGALGVILGPLVLVLSRGLLDALAAGSSGRKA